MLKVTALVNNSTLHRDEHQIFYGPFINEIFNVLENK